jgi:hypothetical protein
LESFLSILLPNEGVHEAVTPLLLSHDTSLTNFSFRGIKSHARTIGAPVALGISLRC